MDPILNPEMLHIGARHYRINYYRQNFSINKPNLMSQIEENLDVEEDEEEEKQNEELEPELIEINKNIKSYENGFQVSIKIPTLFHRFIIGSHHLKRKNLEEEFRCQLEVPSLSSNSSLIKISASSKFNILHVCRRLLWIVSNARSSLQPTHFICLPLNNSKIKENFQNFRNSILKLADKSSSLDFLNVDSSVFKNDSLLHLTLVTLVLADEEEISLACDLLENFCKNNENYANLFLDGPLNLTIQGLEYMNDDPTAVNVLYAKINESHDFFRLQQIANNLLNYFTEHNLTSRGPYRPDNNVKLHMTIMNSKHRSEKQEFETNNSFNQRIAFSIKGILKEYSNYCFGQNEKFSSIHLSERLNYDPDSKFYKCCCEIQFPTNSEPVTVKKNVQ